MSLSPVSKFSGSGLLSCSVVPSSPELLFPPRDPAAVKVITRRERERGREWVRESNKYRVCFLIQTSGRKEEGDERRTNFVPESLGGEISLPHPYPLFSLPALRSYFLCWCCSALLPIDHLIPFSNRNRGTFEGERSLFSSSCKTLIPYELLCVKRVTMMMMTMTLQTTDLTGFHSHCHTTDNQKMRYNRWPPESLGKSDRMLQLKAMMKEGYIKHLFPSSRFLISWREAWIEKRSISPYINLSLHPFFLPSYSLLHSFPSIITTLISWAACVHQMWHQDMHYTHFPSK